MATKKTCAISTQSRTESVRIFFPSKQMIP